MTRPGGQRLPGNRLRAWASRICSATAMTRLIDPVIADLQSEYADASRRGHVWRSRWVRLAGYLAFWKVLGVCAAVRVPHAIGDWAAADDRAIGRTLAFSLVPIATVTGLLMYVPFSQTQRAGAEVMRPLLPYLIPQALPIAIPIGFAIGILCALRGRVANRQTARSIALIAIVCSVLMLFVLGWVVPEANHAFRVRLAGRWVARGVNELTLGQLRSKGRWFQYHERLALSVATLTLAMFAYGATTAVRGRRGSLAIGLAGIIVYAWLWLTVQVHHDAVTHFVDAWLPNLVIVAAAVALMRKRVHI